MMVLEQENCQPIQDPTIENIKAAVGRVHPRRHSYARLVAGKTYVQMAGAPLRLTLEYQSGDEGIRHYRLGRSPAVSETLSLNYSGGPITVQRNEVLSSDDFSAVFKEFLNSQSVPDSYVLRELDANYN